MSRSRMVASGVGVFAVLSFVVMRRRMRRRSAQKNAAATSAGQSSTTSSLQSDSLALGSQAQLRLPIRVSPGALPAEVGGWAVGEAQWLYDRVAVIPLLVPIAALPERRHARESSLENAFVRVKILRRDDTPETYWGKRHITCTPLTEKEGTQQSDIGFHYALQEPQHDEIHSTVTVGRNVSLPDGTMAVCTLTLIGRNLTDWASLLAESVLRLEELGHAIAFPYLTEQDSLQRTEGQLQLFVRDSSPSASNHRLPIPCDRTCIRHDATNHTLQIERDQHRAVIPLRDAVSTWQATVFAPSSCEKVDGSNKDLPEVQWHSLGGKEIGLIYQRDHFDLTFAVPLDVIVSDVTFANHPTVLLQHLEHDTTATVSLVSAPPEEWGLAPPEASAALVSEILEENIARFLVRPPSVAGADQRSAIEAWTVAGTRALTFLERATGPRNGSGMTSSPRVCRTVVLPHPTDRAKFWIIRWEAPSTAWEAMLPNLHDFLAGMTFSCV